MGKRYQELYRLPPNLYLEGCPVIIAAGALQKDTVADKVLAQLKLRNLENKRITACKVTIRAFEPNGDEVEGISEFSYMDQSAGLGVDFGAKVPIYLPDNKTRRISAVVTEIVFADGSVWRGETCEWRQIPIPEQDKLAVKLPDEDLRDEYVREVGALCDYVPVIRNGLFQCACGTANLSTAEVCYNCRRSFDFLTEKMNPEYLAAQREIRLQREKEAREAAERAAAEAEEAARAAAAERERKEKEEAERKAEELRQKKAKLKKTIKYISLISVAVLLVGLFVYATGWHVIPYIRYQNACKAVETQYFDEAYNTFVALGDYSDSSDKAIDTLYQKGVYLMNSGSYLDAAAEFERVSDYQDSKEQAAYCRNEAAYLDAKALFEAGSYKKAADAFTGLSGFSDSAEMAHASNYHYGQELFAKGEYKNAYTVFVALDNYKDSKDQAHEAEYLYASERFDAGDYTAASTAFFLIKGYKDADARFSEAKYLYAIALTEKKNWKAASDVFKELGDYRDSSTRYKDTYYQYGLQLLSSKSYVSAVIVFKNLGDHQESKSKLNEAKYEYVQAHKNNTDITTARYLKDLKALGYKDTTDIYNSLYRWSVKLIALNTSRSNETTISSSISRYSNYVHFDFKLLGGPPGEKLTMSHKVYWPDGSVSNADWYWENILVGSTFGCYWDRLFTNPSNAATGTMTVKVYNKSTGELLGEASVRIT